MNAVGIIAEYNPFHNGHKFHIEEAKKQSGCDHAIVIMSGDFVQRGECAVTDKYLRTKAALMNGADVVLELPIHYATAGAEVFALGGIGALNAVGCVNSLAFGCEDVDPDTFETISKVLADEPPFYKEILKENLKKGLTYPESSAIAIGEFLGNKGVSEIINRPNNILAISYIKAIKLLNSNIKPVPVKRIGSGYNDSSLGDKFPSALAIREMIKNGDTNLTGLIPDSELLAIKENPYFMFNSDFSHMFSEKLIAGDFEKFADVDDALSNRINNLKDNFTDLSSFTSELKTRNYTYARIARALTHILNDVTSKEMEVLNSLNHAPFIKVLGFRKDAEELLSSIMKNAKVPVITKLKKAETMLSIDAFALFQKTVNASARYRICRNIKYNINEPNEYKKGLVII